MARVRRLLLDTVVERAKRRRRCYHNRRHTIAAGELCIVVRQSMESKNYCVECAAAMLQGTLGQVDTLLRELRDS